MSTDINRLADLAVHSGLLYRPECKRLTSLGGIKLNGHSTSADASISAGDQLQIRKHNYQAVPAGPGRLQLIKAPEQIARRFSRPVRVHCGYHKCLTMFSRKVYKRASIVHSATHGLLPGHASRFRHFYHRLDAFYDNADRYGICSLSGHALDLANFEDIRVVRFIRDPRDLIISSYFYHKRGAERWSQLANPCDLDWMVVRGCVPQGIGPNQSLMSYLNDSSLEEGLLAEIEFRKYHLQSMMDWPLEDERVRLYRYEDILGREPEVFAEIADFYQLPPLSKSAARHFADKYRAGKALVKKDHIRNAKSQQWRDLFSPAVKEKFNQMYADLLHRYQYPLQ